MESQQIKLIYKIELQNGEKLTLPDSLVENISAGSWIITIEPLEEETPQAIHSHDAFLKGYAPEDERLYDDYPTRSKRPRGETTGLPLTS